MSKPRILLWLLAALLLKIILTVLYEVVTNDVRRCFGLDPQDKHGGGGHGGHG